jgi:hypothetical protein
MARLKRMGQFGFWVAMGALLVGGCSSDQGIGQADLARMYNQKRGFRAVNLTDREMAVYYDDHIIQGAESFGTTSGFLLARRGPRKLEVKLDGSVAHSEMLDIPSGENKTIYATLEKGKPKVRVMDGDQRSGEGRDAVVRVLNMAEGVEVQDVVLQKSNSVALADRLGALQGGRSLKIEAGVYSAIGKVAGREVRKEGLVLDSGRSYSLILARPNAKSAPEWVFLSNNKREAPSAGGASPVG